MSPAAHIAGIPVEEMLPWVGAGGAALLTARVWTAARVARLTGRGRSGEERTLMFEQTKAFSGFAVDDIDRARAFYGETLGIRVTAEHGLLTLHLAGGDRPTLVYPKPDHEPATYTVLNFPVEDIDAAVDALVDRGVTFERYEGADERGVMRAIGPPIAWFRDPAGNVLAVLQED
jgi:catechol 2,3-dioxygenase-like lactoylglutathione lyase family enzyme